MTRAVASDPNVQAAVIATKASRLSRNSAGARMWAVRSSTTRCFWRRRPHPKRGSKARGGQVGKAFRTFARRLRAIGKALEDLISRLQADLKRSLAGAAARRVDAHGRAEDAAEDVGPWGAALVALASLIILVALIKVKGRR